MRKLTTEEMNATYEVIKNTKWVNDLVNRELANGKEWDLVMYQVAEAFGIVK